MRAKFVSPQLGGRVCCVNMSWMTWIMLGPKLDQFVWKKRAWKPSGPGTFNGGSSWRILKISSGWGILTRSWAWWQKGLLGQNCLSILEGGHKFCEVARNSFLNALWMCWVRGSSVSHKPLSSFRVTTWEWLRRWRVLRWKNFVLASPWFNHMIRDLRHQNKYSWWRTIL